MQKSLGLIETQGLLGGITAADAAVKSANVELIGYELTKGGGWTTVKIQGDVGAVKAAVDAAKIAAGKVCRVVSTRVIPRPAAALEMLVENGDTVGYQPPEPPADPEPPVPPKPPVTPGEPEKEAPAPVPEEAPEPQAPAAPETAEEAPVQAAEPAPEVEAPVEESAAEPEPEAPAEEPVPEPEATPEVPAEPPVSEEAPAVEPAPGPEAAAEEGEAPAPAKPRTARKTPAKKGGKRKQ